MKLFLHIVFLWFSTTILSQSNWEKDFNFYRPSTKLYVMGEDHFENDIQLQTSIIEYILSKTEVNVFIFEYAKEVGEIFNEYVLYGKRENDVKGICSLVNPVVGAKTKTILDLLRNYNLSSDRKIRVCGIDTLQFYKLKRQQKALKIIYPELEKISTPILNKIVSKRNPRNYNKSKSRSLIDSLIVDYHNNYEIHFCFMNERADRYRNSLEDLKLYYDSRSYRTLDSIREVQLSNNLMDVVDSNAVSLMVCGAAHAMYKESDSWYFGYPYTSMVANLKRKYPDQVFSIVTQHYHKKLVRFFPEFNLLNTEQKEYFEDCNKRYHIITESELDIHIIAKERCDMVIIQNMKWTGK